MTGDKVEELGHEVIYGDTDSIFVKLKTSSDDVAGSVERIGKELESYINKFYTAYVLKNYQRESKLELEFEKTYKKFFMPHVRGSEAGAKKRYAGIIEKDGKDDLQFVGLEYVRSDWTKAAKFFQKELLLKVFDGAEVNGFVKEFVGNLESGKYDEMLKYRKWIRKNVAEYTKTTPPHIKAARKIGKTGTGLIEYYYTIDGPEAAEALKHKINYDHYIEKQIKPIADSILVFLNTSFDDITKGKQKSLFDY